MDQDPFAPLFNALGRIAPVPVEEAAYFRTSLRRTVLPKGDFFIRGGQPATRVGYLVTGLIRYFYIADSGKEFIKHFCYDGHFVAPHAALHNGSPSDYFIEALEETVLITFSHKDWMALVGRHPVWGVLNGRILDQALAMAEKRERSLILDSALTRYRAVLEEIPGIEKRVRQYDMANYLGITPVALSRIRGKIAPN